MLHEFRGNRELLRIMWTSQCKQSNQWIYYTEIEWSEIRGIPVPGTDKNN